MSNFEHNTHPEDGKFHFVLFCPAFYGSRRWENIIDTPLYLNNKYFLSKMTACRYAYHNVISCTTLHVMPLFTDNFASKSLL